MIGAGLLFASPGDTMSSSDMSDYILSRAYLVKNTELYTRCYNSINHGTSGLIDVELALKSEHFNDPRVSFEKMKSIEKSFLNGIKQKCDSSIDDYESAYEKVEEVQKRSESLRVGWRTFLFGGGTQVIPTSEVFQYDPGRVRMTTPFNSYIFTLDEAKAFYEERLGL